MADIDVERKGPSIWPWIIGLILLALLIWGLFELLGDDEAAVVDQDVVEEPVVAPGPVPPVGEGAAAAPPAVAEYTTTCTPPLPADMEMGRQHQFTAQCLESLAASLDAVIQRDQVAGTDVSQRLQTLRDRAQALRQSGPQATTHANLTREAFTAGADLIESTHRAGYSTVTGLGNEVAQVRSAAEAVQPGTQMLNQRDAVHNFFREAGDVVTRMAETPAART